MATTYEEALKVADRQQDEWMKKMCADIYESGIQSGALVRHIKLEGPVMSVGKVDLCSGLVECFWFDKADVPHTHKFSYLSLGVVG
jgi:uncharacterized protein YodC (DUF2158 family)